MSASPALQFTDPVFGAQSTFRRVMDTMANPGCIETVAMPPSALAALMPGMAAVVLTLCDIDTPVWLGEELSRTDEVARHLAFQCGCRIVSEPSAAQFALVVNAARCPRFDEFAQGSLDYPDRSTTLLIEVAELEAQAGFAFEGPGIRGRRGLRAQPLPSDFSAQWLANRSRFPQGIDLVLCCGTRLAALPRSTRIVE